VYRAAKPLHPSVEVGIADELGNVELSADFVGACVVLGVSSVCKG
jgi:hypothetical protein